MIDPLDVMTAMAVTAVAMSVLSACQSPWTEGDAAKPPGESFDAFLARCVPPARRSERVAEPPLATSQPVESECAHGNPEGLCGYCDAYKAFVREAARARTEKP